MTKYTNLSNLFVLKLKALYDIENELTKALPKLAKKATDPGLQAAFEDHLQETHVHVERLEQCFKLIGVRQAKTKVEGIRGIIADTEFIIKERPTPQALDVMLIASASYAEHYEIAGYSSAIKWARHLGHEEVGALLEETLIEEENAEDKLASLADDGIDEAAISDDSMV